jgi:hypothetical protein
MFSLSPDDRRGQNFVVELPDLTERFVIGRIRSKTADLSGPIAVAVPDFLIDNDRLAELFEERLAGLFTGEPSGDVDVLDVERMQGKCRCGKTFSPNRKVKVDLAEGSAAASYGLFNALAPRLEPLKAHPFLANRIVFLYINTDHIDAHCAKRLHEMDQELRKAEMEPTKRAVPLEQCFEWFSISEILDENNKWFCPNCRTFVCADKKMDVWSLAPVLVLHLKRFVGGRSGAARKFDGFVDFPEVLDMTKYVVGPQKHESLQYKLFAVSEHSGGLGGGHYTAHARVTQSGYRKGKWYSFNDSSVRVAGEGAWQQSSAYVLFYEREEDEPEEADSTSEQVLSDNSSLGSE